MKDPNTPRNTVPKNGSEQPTKVKSRISLKKNPTIIASLIGAVATVLSPIIVLAIQSSYNQRHVVSLRPIETSPTSKAAFQGMWEGEAYQERGPGGIPLKYTVYLTISWKGNAIQGKYAWKYLDQTGREIIDSIPISGGLYYDRFIKLEYTVHPKGKLLVGSTLLRLSDDATQMGGYDVGYGSASHNIAYAELKFKKIG